MRCDAALLSCWNWFLATADKMEKKKKKKHILQPAAAGYFPPSSRFLPRCCCLAINKLQEVGEKTWLFPCTLSGNMRKIADMDDGANEVEAKVLWWMFELSDDDQIKKFTHCET